MESNFINQWFSKRNTKQHKLDVIRMKLISLIPLPSMEDDAHCDSACKSFAAIMSHARKIKKRKLNSVIRQLDEFIADTQDKYNDMMSGSNLDQFCSAVYHTIGTDTPTYQLMTGTTIGEKLGCLAVLMDELAHDKTNDPNMTNPYHPLYYATVLTCYLYARCEHDENEEMSGVVKRSVKQCISESCKFLIENEVKG